MRRKDEMGENKDEAEKLGKCLEIGQIEESSIVTMANIKRTLKELFIIKEQL